MAGKEAPRVGSGDQVPSSRCPDDAQASPEAPTAQLKSLSWGQEGGLGPESHRLSTRPALRSLDRTQPSVLQIPLAPVSLCPLTPPHPSSGPLRTLQIPGRTFRRKQVDQSRPPIQCSPLPRPRRLGTLESPKQFRGIPAGKRLNSDNFLHGDPRFLVGKPSRLPTCRERHPDFSEGKSP